MTDSGTTARATKRCFDWLEIKQHNTQEDCWLVLDGKVYNVTGWANYHPGGRRLLSYHAGRDATEFFNAFHKDKDYTKKFLKPLYIGDAEEYEQSELVKDFASLRATAEEMGLFVPSFKYFSLMMLHVLLLEITAYLVLLIFGTWWLPFSISALLQSIYVMQGSWLQHDFGHGSPCKSRFWKKVFHYINGSLIMGMSPRWWNDLHFRHHSKPNVIEKDPDLILGPFYVQGEVMAIEAAHGWKNPLPFDKQHIYFFLVGPPILFSVLMQLTAIVFIIVNKCWLDLLMGSLCFLRYYYLYEPLLGFRWMLIMFACMRCIQSHWFTFVALSNHVAMPISYDESRSWFKHQVESTVNIEPSMFNHWFTGGLNSHIEHHLFPTMPRHNFHKITPSVKALCDKHHIKYTEKPFGKAVLGLISSLKSYGALWKKTKEELHVD